MGVTFKWYEISLNRSHTCSPASLTGCFDHVFKPRRCMNLGVASVLVQKEQPHFRRLQGAPFRLRREESGIKSTSRNDPNMADIHQKHPWCGNTLESGHTPPVWIRDMSLFHLAVDQSEPNILTGHQMRNGQVSLSEAAGQEWMRLH